MLTFIAAAFFAALGALAIWCTRVASEKNQKLTDVLAAETQRTKDHALSEAGLSARANSDLLVSDELSARPLPVQDYRD